MMYKRKGTACLLLALSLLALLLPALLLPGIGAAAWARGPENSIREADTEPENSIREPGTESTDSIEEAADTDLTGSIKEAEAEPEDDSKKAEILLVYEADPTQEELVSLEVIVKTLTYLQHSVAYLPSQRCTDLLSEYDNILCFNLGRDSREFYQKLASLDKNVLILGGEGVADYITGTGEKVVPYPVDTQAATVDYAFDQESEFSDILRLEHTFLLEGEFSGQSGTVVTGNRKSGLYVRTGSFWYTPVSNLSNDLTRAAFAKEAAEWLWPYKGEPHSQAQYIVLNEVYPFTSPEKLLEIVEYLVDRKLPFVISVMPIYENGDYPAMKRFCEILRYAQANKAAVILHMPYTVQAEDDLDQLWQYLTIATEAYTNFGIYPLGLQVPERYLFDQTGREVMKRYSTVFCYKEDALSGLSPEEGYNTVYDDGHFLIAPAYSAGQEASSRVKTLSAAAYIDITGDMESIEEQIASCVRSEVPAKSLWELDHAVYANNLFLFTEQGELYFNYDKKDLDYIDLSNPVSADQYSIYTNSGQVYFNNEKISLEYKPFDYGEFDYGGGVMEAIAEDLSGLNRQLIVIVVAASIIFTVFILIARTRNRKRFLIKRRKEEENGVG